MKSKPELVDFVGRAWAILPETLRALAASDFSSESLAHPRAAAPTSRDQFGDEGGVVCVLPIRGVIWHRPNFVSQIFGGATVQNLTSQFREALGRKNVKAIVFDVDSPGGTVDGVPELADEIYKSRGQKKTVAVANGMAASAAYWLASAAGELVVAPSGQVGSIGVYSAHEDLSKAYDQVGVKITLVSAGKYKTDGSDIEPLSDSARADMQSKVDAFYGMFVQSVARGRGASQGGVRGGFGQGRMVLADAAVKEGMADRVGTLDQALTRIASGGRSGMSARASGAPLNYMQRLELELITGEPDPELAHWRGRLKLDRLRRELDRV